MAYPKEETVQAWLTALRGLNVCVKKMFGCYCMYCDDQPVGWLSGEVLSLREVGLAYLPPTLKRPNPADAIQEIPIPMEYCGCEWLPRAVQDTAKIRKAEYTANTQRKRKKHDQDFGCLR